MRVGHGGFGKALSGRIYGLMAAMATLLAVGFGPTVASASAEVTLPGSPLTVSVGPLGQCESSYAEHGNNFYPPFGNLGDCGFFLAFPKEGAGKAGAGQPAVLEGTTWGFSGAAGPHIPGDAEGGDEYAPVEQSPVTGAGTEASPYSQTTIFSVKEKEGAEKEYARITDTTTYVSGQPQFVSTYDVKNVLASGHKIYFRAIYAGDMFLLGSDFGTGVFLGGPPRFVGGQNPESGALGGLVEASGLPWSSFQEGCWNDAELENAGRCSGAAATDQGIWHDVRSSDEVAHAFNETVDPANIDNAVGVEWDQLRESGLEGGAEQSFTIINRSQVPSNLQIGPVNQTLTQGQTATVTVTATDLAGVPYAGKILHYNITGANPQAGTITLNAAGQAQISYVGHNAGLDTDQLFVDLTGTGVQAAGDPAGAATVTFLPLPPAPAPNSSYKVESIHANSNGTITITFVPTQAGAATLEITVPTGTIARREALAAKSKKCKKGQIKIKGKCLPATTLTGKVHASGVAGVALKLTVSASSKVKKALSEGKTVVLTAKLTYTSSLGGAPTVETFHFKVKGKKPKKH